MELLKLQIFCEVLKKWVGLRQYATQTIQATGCSLPSLKQLWKQPGEGGSFCDVMVGGFFAMQNGDVIIQEGVMVQQVVNSPRWRNGGAAYKLYGENPGVGCRGLWEDLGRELLPFFQGNIRPLSATLSTFLENNRHVITATFLLHPTCRALSTSYIECLYNPCIANTWFIYMCSVYQVTHIQLNL